jgi:hypothetical protein
MTGVIDGSNVATTMTENTDDVLSFIGIIGSGTMSGTYSSTGTCTNGISGSFSFALIPAITSTQWKGMITSSSTSAGVVANLTEDADANLTGTFQVSGTACLSGVKLTFSVTGIQVYFQDTQGGAMVNVAGTISGSDAKQISGFAGGSCSGGGSLTMSRP